MMEREGNGGIHRIQGRGRNARNAWNAMNMKEYKEDHKSARTGQKSKQGSRGTRRCGKRKAAANCRPNGSVSWS